MKEFMMNKFAFNKGEDFNRNSTMNFKETSIKMNGP